MSFPHHVRKRPRKPRGTAVMHMTRNIEFFVFVQSQSARLIGGLSAQGFEAYQTRRVPAEILGDRRSNRGRLSARPEAEIIHGQICHNKHIRDVCVPYASRKIGMAQGTVMVIIVVFGWGHRFCLGCNKTWQNYHAMFGIFCFKVRGNSNSVDD